MRPRSVGGLEPDDAEQLELSSLWHLSRTALCHVNPLTRAMRVDWAIDEFLKAHPEVARKWVYVWAVENLGTLTTGAPVPDELTEQNEVASYRDAYVTSIARQWFGDRK